MSIKDDSDHESKVENLLEQVVLLLKKLTMQLELEFGTEVTDEDIDNDY